MALAQNPPMLERLREEIKEIYEKESPPSLNTLNKMDWLSALLKESLRVNNPVALGTGIRKASRDNQIGDISIKEGSIVIASFLHKTFNPQLFEDPMGYNPQRWLEKSSISDPYAYTPFWAGPRNCIGQHLALIESKVILCEFLKKFNFELLEDYKSKVGQRVAFDLVDNVPMNLTVKQEQS